VERATAARATRRGAFLERLRRAEERVVRREEVGGGRAIGAPRVAIDEFGKEKRESVKVSRTRSAVRFFDRGGASGRLDLRGPVA
jgi:hypothetical protein